MRVSVEAPSKLERRVTVEVPVERLNEIFEKRIAKLAKQVKIAGFRPGKAPLNIVRQRFGNDAREEALSEVIQSSLYEAINQEKLNPVDVPTVEAKVIAPDKPLEFIATFEVFPEVGTVNFDVKALEKQISSITDPDIDKVLERLREQNVRWKKVDRAAKEKDQAIIDFRGSIDGNFFSGGEAHDYPIVLGSKTMIPGFEEGVIGAKEGEEKTIKVNFPQDYFSADVAGKEAEFTIKVIKVSEPELDAIDENFIKKFGIKSGDVNELRSEIKKNLERELDRVVRLKLKNQVFDKLLEQNPIEIPKSLINREAKRIHDQVHPNHDHAHSHTEAENAAFATAAKRNVTLGLLVSELIKQNNISVNKERVQNYLSSIASVYENPAEVMNWYSKNKNAYAEAEMQVMEEVIVEKLLENVKVTDKELSYQELVSEKNLQGI